MYQAQRVTATKPSKLDNLDKVWGVLNEIRDDGSRDYSLAEVGRRLEKIGGPRTQSLRNAQGAPYRDIITAFVNAVSGANRYVAKTKSNVEQALSLITNPSIRATLRVALDDAKRLKVVNDNLQPPASPLRLAPAYRRLPSSSPSPNPEVRLNADLKQEMSKRVPVRTKAKLRQAATAHMKATCLQSWRANHPSYSCYSVAGIARMVTRSAAQQQDRKSA